MGFFRCKRQNVVCIINRRRRLKKAGQQALDGNIDQS